MKKKVIYINDNFRYLKSRIAEKGIKEVSAVLFDLGLSSPHVDDCERGFSFIKEGPLDMRFDLRGELTAADVINRYEEEELARVIYEYGEERRSRQIARKICTKRKAKPFTTTKEFADFIAEILPKEFKKKGKFHPATRIFQALRIEVNDEINALKEALVQATDVMCSGGRIVVISYHSLEDRVVKHFFKELMRPPVKSAEESLYRSYGEPLFISLTKKPVIPTETEIAENPRSRSAKLRAYQKI